MDETRVIELADGRDLAWIEVGDSDGAPVFAFHGTPSSRLSFTMAPERTRAAGVRLICPDRPGYGHSSYQRRRRLIDWPNDVAALADHLDLDRFAVMGVSGGGPHAAVCGARLGDRVRACAIVSGVGPIGEDWAIEGMMPLNRASARLARRSQLLVRPPMSAIVTLMRSQTERALDGMAKQSPPPDRAILERPDVRAMLRRDASHASRTAARAAAQDFAIFARPWGFELSDLRVPTRLWQGDEDVNVPMGTGTGLHERIPGSTLVEVTGAGHWLIIDHWEEILAFCTSPEG